MNKETKTKVIKGLITILILVAILLAIYLPLQLSGTLAKIDSPEKLKELILRGGAYSYLIFFVIQFLQVTFLPIPAFITTVAGSLVFGPWIASAVSFLAIMTASVFSFYLGRKLGRKIINWIVGLEEADKWADKLARGKYIFFLMMLLPVFPDDILCMIVGATSMSFRFFFYTNLITRPISILTTCFVGSGHLIPFSGWGIPVWIVMGIALVVVFYLSFKYQPQIENFVVKLGEKITFKNKKKPLLLEYNCETCEEFHKDEAIIKEDSKVDSMVKQTMDENNKDNISSEE